MEKTRASAALLLLLAGLSAHAGQIVINPGFETGALAPWFEDRVFNSAVPWHVTNADKHSGSFSASDDGDRELRQNLVPTPVADIVEVSFWLRQPVPHVFAPFLFYSDATSSPFHAIFPNTNQWAHYDITSWLAPGKTLVAFSLFGYVFGGAGGDVTFLDDVVIRTEDEVVPEPGTLALCGLGLIALRRRSRRR